MSTSSPTAPARSGLDLSASKSISFPRLVKVELRKAVDTRAGFWLLGITVLFTIIVMALVLLVVTLEDVPTNYGNFLSTTAYSSSLLLPVLGILLVTGEWGQRTAMVTFTLVPRRSRVVWAKLVAGLALAAAVAVFASVLAVLANLLYGLIEGQAPDWEVGWAFFGGFLASQAFAMLIGFALAALFLNTPAAIVVYFVYFFVLPIPFAIAAAFLDWFRDLQPWVDFAYAQTPLVEGEMAGKDWAHLATSGFIWLVLPLALGLWRIMRAEVK